MEPRTQHVTRRAPERWSLRSDCAHLLARLRHVGRLERLAFARQLIAQLAAAFRELVRVDLLTLHALDHDRAVVSPYRIAGGAGRRRGGDRLSGADADVGDRRAARDLFIRLHFEPAASQPLRNLPT